MRKPGVPEAALAVASVAGCVGLFFALLQVGVWWLDLPDPEFRYENALPLWRPDPRLSFANRRDFRAFAFGDVPVETNERGFRGTAPTPPAPAPGVRRVVAVGDSVMWGTGVTERDSLPGLLAGHLAGGWEVVNAAVVGYGSLQEQLQLERDVLPLQPRVVLLNFCANDLLPSEDPFEDVRGVYLRDLAALEEAALAPEQRVMRRQLQDLLEDSGSVWRGLTRLERETPGLRGQVVEWWIARPYARMAARARDAGVRLVVLFIPTRSGSAFYARTVERLKEVLREGGAEFIDFQEAFAPEPGAEADEPRSPWQGSRFSAWRPAQLDQIIRWLHFRRLRAESLYIDTFHLSPLGNAVVADGVEELLAAPPAAAGEPRNGAAR